MGPNLQHAPHPFTHAHLSIRRNIGSVEDGDVEETRTICRKEWLLRGRKEYTDVEHKNNKTMTKREDEEICEFGCILDGSFSFLHVEEVVKHGGSNVT